MGCCCSICSLMGHLMGLPAFLVVHWIPAGESQLGVECLSFPVLHLTPSIIPGCSVPAAVPGFCRGHSCSATAAGWGSRECQLLWVRAVLDMHCPVDDTALGTGGDRQSPEACRNSQAVEETKSL